MRKYVVTLWLVGMLSLGLGTGSVLYYGYRALVPATKPTPAPILEPKKVTDQTQIRQEKIFLCGEKEQTVTGPWPAIKGLTEDRIKKQFSAQEGWEVEFPASTLLILRKRVDDFCPVHREYRHLGVEQGFLAIYHGPLGGGGLLLQREAIPVEQLPAELRSRLYKVKQWQQLTEAEKEDLRRVLEFKNDGALNSFLDNLDEYREE
ncbi:hypothetical protein SAMN02745885_02443 [Carboxydocella sporoproducens DSM 16521]|uniref:Bypass of forespore C C-terminal domain-containing protein n=2 Tax=Carboxydocella TaxID=178898 RepID=A0A1T4S5Z9_9FIRM|nr:MULTISPECIES: hypothetical protein [Carboxydocella]AVX21518.1 hypothetical protein CFE_2375 [Carboxydocella thermautotrophica]SKA23318.1 hypothetical protein SAMN02745885_02443 [Carboxydocella sporoproducens DSM 16521]